MATTTRKKATRTPIDPNLLYPVASQLSSRIRDKLGFTHKVTVYPQDPLVAERNKEHALKRISLTLDWEPGLMDGPSSSRVTVVDFDADLRKLDAPAHWDEEARCFTLAHWDEVKGSFVEDKTPVAKQPGSAQFRQVNAWAIVEFALSFFEDPAILGRKIPWAFGANRLIVVPHAGYARNAYYDRNTGTLQFYYCGPAEDRVYTCLSHDIIAHEAGHAILDGIRPYYIEPTSAQTAGFHEFFADLTAVMLALRHNPVRKAVADRCQADLKRDTIIADLAEEFGESLGSEGGKETARTNLRSAMNSYDMDYLATNLEPHECSQVLTGAMFDILALMAVAIRDGKTGADIAEAFAMGSEDAEPEPSEEESQDEKAASVNASSYRGPLWTAFDAWSRLTMRALDYCPPVDIQYADFARAVLRADELAYPTDHRGYRAIARVVFGDGEGGRKILKLQEEHELFPSDFRGLDITRIAGSLTAAYRFIHDNRETLHIPPYQDFIIADLYDTKKSLPGARRLPREIVIEYLWSEDVELAGRQFGPLDGQYFPLWCGGTLVFDSIGNVLSWAYKPGIQWWPKNSPLDRQHGEERLAELRTYLAYLAERGMIGRAQAPRGGGIVTGRTEKGLRLRKASCAGGGV
jgi:hypothetical protein